MQKERTAYSWVAFAEGSLPGEMLCEHPDDVRPGASERLWEILQLIVPNGDIVTVGIPGPAGEPFDEQRLADARHACMRAVAAADGEGPERVSILNREYRIEYLE